MVDGFLSAARQEFPCTWAAMEGMSVTLSERGVDVALPESRLGQRRRIRFAATVSGQTVDGAAFEEKATLRDISLQGAYLSLSNRPRLQSELRLVIEARWRTEPIEHSLAARDGRTLRRPAGKKIRTAWEYSSSEDAESESPRD